MYVFLDGDKIGVKWCVYIVREMIFIFMYLIFPLITYILQCYLASQENDKQRPRSNRTARKRPETALIRRRNPSVQKCI
jgi:hypothetical protein